MDFYPILLQASGGGQPGWLNFAFIFGIFAIFYFFIIRPQQQKAKDERKFTEAIKKGDKVAIFGGIHGKVISVKESTAVVQIGDGTNVTVEKAAIKDLPAAS